LAQRFRVPPFIIGATIIAFGTSMPELVVTLTAALKNSPGLALGNIVGSNIANLGLILGIAALLMPVSIAKSDIKKETLSILGVMILMVLFSFDGKIYQIEGIILLIAMGGFIVLTLFRIRTGPAEAETPVIPPHGTAVTVMMIIGGIAALILGGQLLVDGAVTISRMFGVSEYVIGALAVAIGTSLPEVAASVSAALHGKGELAIGNVFGSNAFNVLFVLGTGATIKPITVMENIVPDLVFFVVLTIFPLAILLIKQSLSRWQGVLLLIIYIAYVIKVIA